MELKTLLFNFAKEKDIIIGVCDAERLEYLIPVLENSNTPFVRKIIEQRIDPKNERLLKTARSIIAVGVKYPEADSAEQGRQSLKTEGHCKISKMALDTDYHVRVRNILEDLASKIQECCEFQYKILVDSGYLVEREFAKKAGLGFIGKNRMLISVEIGSFFNIGLMLTDLSATDSSTQDYYNTPLGKSCGSCDLCIKACPTGALGENGYDYTKCVSYLTQFKGELTEEQLKMMGKNIYGCDVCQNVCPYNKDKVEVFLDIRSLIDMTEDEYKKKYKDKSLYWIGYDTFIRNIRASAVDLSPRTLPTQLARTKHPHGT